MFAVIAFICGVVAAILKLVDKHANWILWLLIIGLIAIAIEGVWGWHRAGYYGRRAALAMPATLDQILNALNTINRKLDVLMSQQDDITADVQAVQQAVDDLGAAATAIEAEIAALKAANPSLDLSGLDAVVGSLKSAVTAVASIAPPPAA